MGIQDPVRPEVSHVVLIYGGVTGNGSCEYSYDSVTGSLSCEYSYHTVTATLLMMCRCQVVSSPVRIVASLYA